MENTTDQFSLTVDRSRLLPRHCSSGLPHLMGFGSTRACLSAINRQSPFNGYTLQQIARMSGSVESSQIKMIDRHCRVVGRLTHIEHRSGNEIELTISPEAEVELLATIMEETSLAIDPVEGSLEWKTDIQCLDPIPLKLEELLQLVLIEERDWFQDCLARLSRGMIDNLYFRMLDNAGDIIEAHYRSGSGLQLARRLEGTLVLHHPGRTRRFAFASLGGVPGIVVTSRHVAVITPGFQLEVFLRNLQSRLREGWYEQRLTLALESARFQCSICGAMCAPRTEEQITPINIRMDDVRPGEAAFHALLDASRTQFQPSPLTLLPLLDKAHARGMHVALSLDDHRCLRLTMMAAV